MNNKKVQSRNLHLIYLKKPIVSSVGLEKHPYHDDKGVKEVSNILKIKSSIFRTTLKYSHVNGLSHITNKKDTDLND